MTVDVHNLHQAANDELIKGNDEKAIEIYTKIIELAPVSQEAPAVPETPTVPTAEK